MASQARHRFVAESGSSLRELWSRRLIFPEFFRSMSYTSLWLTGEVCISAHWRLLLAINGVGVENMFPATAFAGPSDEKNALIKRCQRLSGMGLRLLLITTNPSGHSFVISSKATGNKTVTFGKNTGIRPSLAAIHPRKPAICP